jgi:hypothetical protein
MSQLQILITSIKRKPRPIVVQSDNLLGWYHGTFVFTRNTDLVFIDVVPKMNKIVDAVLTSGIAVCVEVT